jgi:hypothetical protein
MKWVSGEESRNYDLEFICDLVLGFWDFLDVKTGNDFCLGFFDCNN